jgi:hypothetical protein
MISKKKIIVSAALTGLSLATVVTGVNAFFIETADTDTSGVVGDVELVNDSIKVTNIGNFNPGDENPESNLPSGHRAGTEHKLEYTIHNNGSKSITTRSVVDITLTGTDGKILDPSVITLYQTKDGKTTTVKMENAKDSSIRENTILGERCYVLTDGSVVTSKPSDTSTIKSLRYILLGPNLNGVGDAAEIEEKATDSKADVSYAVALDYDTPDSYQGADISFDVNVECMQYRNTNSADWKTIFKDHLTASSTTA